MATRFATSIWTETWYSDYLDPDINILIRLCLVVSHAKVMLRIEARRTAREGTPPDRYRTCCDCCNVKFGTLALGIIEALLSSVILVSVVQQLVWKSRHSNQCMKNFLRDCLIFKFRHFNVTLIFDYIIALMMIFIILSVLLMFCGILSDTSTLLLPHLLVQGFFLLFSAGYFVLYAWSYFYGDLYTNGHDFNLQALLERMWLATLLMLLAAFQTYLFTSVVRCSLYLSKIEAARRRRESAFERCSERVRLAKENGLWRTASWGGGFMQYDENKPVKEKKAKPNAHVQWSAHVVIEEEEVMREIQQRYELPPAKPEYSSDKDTDKLSRSSSQGSSASASRHGRHTSKSSSDVSPPRVSVSHRISDSSHQSEASSQSKETKHKSAGSPPKRESSKTSVEIEASPPVQHHYHSTKAKRPPLRLAGSLSFNRTRSNKSVDSSTMTDSPVVSVASGRRRSSLGAEEHGLTTPHHKIHER